MRIQGPSVSDEGSIWISDEAELICDKICFGD